MSFKKVILPVAAFATMACFGLSAAHAADKAAAAGLSKADVEQIVHDYIVSNPQLILDSVSDYQKKEMASRSTEGLKKNKETLVNDNNSPVAGNPKGDVTVVEFFDYNCHFCKGAFPAVQTLIEKDKNVRVVFKEFPILGPTSETAAKWALAAEKQGKYYAFHTAMMNNKEPISDSLLEKVAKDVGMDVARAKADAQSSDILVQIEKNRTLAGDMGLNGTPAFVIGDSISRGAIPLEEMESKVAAARAAKK